MWQPVEPRVEGAEYLEGYETVSINPDDFEGQTVLILGELSHLEAVLWGTVAPNLGLAPQM